MHHLLQEMQCRRTAVALDGGFLNAPSASGNAVRKNCCGAGRSVPQCTICFRKCSAEELLWRWTERSSMHHLLQEMKCRRTAVALDGGFLNAPSASGNAVQKNCCGAGRSVPQCTICFRKCSAEELPWRWTEGSSMHHLLQEMQCRRTAVALDGGLLNAPSASRNAVQNNCCGAGRRVSQCTICFRKCSAEELPWRWTERSSMHHLLQEMQCRRTVVALDGGFLNAASASGNAVQKNRRGAGRRVPQCTICFKKCSAEELLWRWTEGFSMHHLLQEMQCRRTAVALDGAFLNAPSASGNAVQKNCCGAGWRVPQCTICFRKCSAEELLWHWTEGSSMHHLLDGAFLNASSASGNAVQKNCRGAGRSVPQCTICWTERSSMPHLLQMFTKDLKVS
ncbi:hypothetical protein NDU88_007588 [Pleurodeles waltl]|uniref:Uncharacterized protein n=1 Tax=Pleurodeles waltl TaxID=8319 RepID=A0AAV7MKP4_PLEWA|nr:hypothetical protein NDU88_007588 [Pleurodeles waltl]